MLINKLKSSADFKKLKEIPEEYFESLSQNTPEFLLKLIGKIIAVFLYRLNVPRKEVENFTDSIERREFAMLFDSFEAYDVQETRRISKEDGLKEGLQLGAERKLVEIICKKILKKYSVSQIADALEEDVQTIQQIYNIAADFAPDYDTDKIIEALKTQENPIISSST